MIWGFQKCDSIFKFVINYNLTIENTSVIRIRTRTLEIQYFLAFRSYTYLNFVRSRRYVGKREIFGNFGSQLNMSKDRLECVL